MPEPTLADPSPHLTPRRDRPAMLRRALRLSAISVALSFLTGGIAVAVALTTGALSLLGFGVNSVIDASASVALLVRFRIERTDPERAARAERLAERAVGVALLALAAYLVYGAAGALLSGTSPEVTPAGVLIPIVAIVLLPALAVAKYRTARHLHSAALRADSFLTGVGAALGAVSLISLLLGEVLDVHWADALGALLMAPVIAREGMVSIGLARHVERVIERLRAGETPADPS
jgi:divalent metal cation (Fe/Co/Zn/Cd) transporter